MKPINYTLTIVFLFIVATGFSQIVNIPDANFKAKLLQADAGNQIAKDLSGNYFKIDANNDGEIQVIEAEQVSYLDLNCSLCATNQKIISIEGIQSFSNIKILFAYDNSITTINLNGLSSIENFHCFDNNISNISLVGLTNLKYFNCQYNLISNLPLDGIPLLEELNVANNLLTSLSTINNNNLKDLAVDENLLTYIDLSSSVESFSCTSNFLTTLDVSNCKNMYNLYCHDNNLTYLNLKNAKIINDSDNLLDLNFGNNPNLEYVCVDEIQIQNVQDLINLYGLTTTCHINTYCSFTPGGNYNTITGSITFDEDNNGCDASDLPNPNIKIDINDGTNQGATFTNNSGNYNFYTQAGSFLLTPNLENPTWFTISPTIATIPFVNNNNNTSTQNFCITANGVHPDLEIAIAPIAPARPGFDAIYQIVYKNKGNQTLSQLNGVNFLFNQNVMDFVSATTAPTTIASSSLSWSYANLLPFESRSIYVTFNINTPTDVNYPVNIDDVLQFTASILPIAGDETSSDNTFLYNQTVVGSFDPNDITCIVGNVVSPSEIGEYLHYIVNFENTGTAEAENIVVKTEIDTVDFEINSLQLLDTSHNCYTRIKGNIVEFVFQNIALDTGGHGNVLLKIRSKSNLVTGDIVSKQANIFFDYNAPIQTNTENTTFQELSNDAFEKDHSISIYPNPTNSIINIDSNNTIKSVQLYDVQGRLLQTKLINETASSIDISDKSNGIYFLKITSDKGIKVEKIVKE